MMTLGFMVGQTLQVFFMKKLSWNLVHTELDFSSAQREDWDYPSRSPSQLWTH